MELILGAHVVPVLITLRMRLVCEVYRKGRTETSESMFTVCVVGCLSSEIFANPVRVRLKKSEDSVCVRLKGRNDSVCVSLKRRDYSV